MFTLGALMLAVTAWAVALALCLAAIVVNELVTQKTDGGST